ARTSTWSRPTCRSCGRPPTTPRASPRSRRSARRGSRGAEARPLERGVAPVLHLPGDRDPRVGAPELLHEIEAQIERGRDAACRHDASLVDDPSVRYDFSAERTQELDRLVV